ncbi:MAG: metallophosphoesterase [Myxococcota bacterium]
MRVKRSGRIRRLGLAVTAIASILAVWGTLLEPRLLWFPAERVVVPHLPAAQEGFTIAVLADLHVGSPAVDLSRLRTLVEETNRRRPDLIVIPGDLLISGVLGGSVVSPEEIAAVLTDLRARRGVVAVLGNHDHDLGRGPAMIRALEKIGIPALENRALELEPGLWIAGFSDLWSTTPKPERAIQPVPANAALIGLTHNPDVFPEVPLRVGLMIAGHTHGGQVRLPLLGAPVVPSRFGSRYLRGLITEAGHQVFVSSGVGTSILPVRLGVPPEIPILTLTSTATGP